MTSCSSGFKASSEKFLQLSCCNIKKFLSYSKNYICRFMKANSWQIIPLSFVLLILESVERKGKITKIWISWERTAFFFDEVTIYPCVVKSKVIQPQSKYLKPEILIRKRLLRDIHWNQIQIGISKYHLFWL